MTFFFLKLTGSPVNFTSEKPHPCGNLQEELNEKELYLKSDSTFMLHTIRNDNERMYKVFY